MFCAERVGDVGYESRVLDDRAVNNNADAYDSVADGGTPRQIAHVRRDPDQDTDSHVSNRYLGKH